MLCLWTWSGWPTGRSTPTLAAAPAIMALRRQRRGLRHPRYQPVLEILETRYVLSAFQATNLVSDIADPPGGAPVAVDPNLKNPWGVAFSATSPFWVSDQGAGVSTLYSSNADGSTISVIPLVVTAPARTDLLVSSRGGNRLVPFNHVTG